jgi:hypothetical protein
MKRKLIALAGLVVLLLIIKKLLPFSMGTENKRIQFIVPLNWSYTGKSSNGVENFRMSKDPDNRHVSGYIRVLVTRKSAIKWATDEVVNLNKNYKDLKITGQPSEKRAGKSTWVALAWESTARTADEKLLVGGQQYYSKKADKLIEVAIVGPVSQLNDVLPADVDAFLSSIHFGAQQTKNKASVATSKTPDETLSLISVHDILGTWDMVYQSTRPDINTNNLFFAKNQILDFTDDGYVRNIATKLADKSKSNETKMAIAILSSSPKRTTFQLIRPGVLMIKRSPSDYDLIEVKMMKESSSFEGVPKDFPIKDGDLLFQYQDSSSKIYMTRFFRKIKK